MICLRREKSNIGSFQVIGHTRQENLVPLCVNELVQSGSNTSDSIDLGHILDWNITRHIINKITPKGRQSERSSCIPNQHERLWIFQPTKAITIRRIEENVGTLHNLCNLLLMVDPAEFELP